MVNDLRQHNGAKPHPLKSAIIEDAFGRIQAGETLEEIAARHNIARVTLKGWLLSMGDEYQQMRSDYIDHQLAEAMDLIDTSQDQLSLARAREQFRCRSFIAERRDRRYASKQEMSVTQVSVDINGLLDQRMARIASSVSTPIDSTCTQVETDDAR